jgi:hypothetical protein
MDGANEEPDNAQETDRIRSDVVTDIISYGITNPNIKWEQLPASNDNTNTKIERCRDNTLIGFTERLRGYVSILFSLNN